MSRILGHNKFYQPRGRLVNVEFGNPKKHDCQGLGICNVEMADTAYALRAKANNCKCKLMQALLSYDTDKREIRFHFRRQDLKPCVLARQFKHGQFVVENRYTFLPALAKYCGLPRGASVYPGTYTITSESNDLLALRISGSRPVPLHLLAAATSTNPNLLTRF